MKERQRGRAAPAQSVALPSHAVFFCFVVNSFFCVQACTASLPFPTSAVSSCTQDSITRLCSAATDFSSVHSRGRQLCAVSALLRVQMCNAHSSSPRPSVIFIFPTTGCGGRAHDPRPTRQGQTGTSPTGRPSRIAAFNQLAHWTSASVACSLTRLCADIFFVSCCACCRRVNRACASCWRWPITAGSASPRRATVRTATTSPQSSQRLRISCESRLHSEHTASAVSQQPQQARRADSSAPGLSSLRPLLPSFCILH